MFERFEVVIQVLASWCFVKGFAHRGQIGLLIFIVRVEKCTPTVL